MKHIKELIKYCIACKKIIVNNDLCEECKRKILIENGRTLFNSETIKRFP